MQQTQTPKPIQGGFSKENLAPDPIGGKKSPVPKNKNPVHVANGLNLPITCLDIW